jgi:hypothetical protein
MLFLQQSELLWDVHTLRPQELGLPFQESPVQKAVLHASVIFQKYPDQFLLEFSWLKKKRSVLCICTGKPLSYLVTFKTVQDAEPVLFPCLHCQEQLKENWMQQ